MEALITFKARIKGWSKTKFFSFGSLPKGNKEEGDKGDLSDFDETTTAGGDGGDATTTAGGDATTTAGGDGDDATETAGGSGDGATTTAAGDGDEATTTAAGDGDDATTTKKPKDSKRMQI